MKTNPIGTIVSNVQVAQDTYYMVIACDAARNGIQPGQFMHLKIAGHEEMLLRRPISVNTVDEEAGTLGLIIQAKGKGTQHLCALPSGVQVDVLGPLGRGFTVDENVKKAAVIGGGIGVAPLRYIIEQHPGVIFDAYLGFRNEQLAYQLEVFESLCDTLSLSSDDGTLGEQGFVTDALAKMMADKDYDAIYACGPTPMVKALQKALAPYDVPCQISLEERMGCGIGACKVCVCRIKAAAGYDNLTVCEDGPVFDLSEVIL